MELSATAYVVLGMLRHEPRSGYEIKAAVDKTTRFFWAASYGQIYPELRRLEEAGLIEGHAEPRGGRQRKVYELTGAGHAELRDWLARGAEVLEMRDEGLLKLFFASAGPEAAIEIVNAKQRLHERKLAALARGRGWCGGGSGRGRPLPRPRAPIRGRVQRMDDRLVRASPGGARAQVMFERLAELAQRRGKWVLVVAAVLFVAAGAFGAGVASHLAPYGADDPATESIRADRLLERAGFRETGVVVLVDGIDANSAAGRERIRAIERKLDADPDVAAVSSYLEGGSRDFVSRDGDSTYVAVSLRPTDDKRAQDAAQHVADSFAGEPDVTVGGASLASAQANDQVEHDLRTAELYAFPLLFLLSLLFFRSLVAAMLPLLVGGLAIVATMVTLRAATEVTDVSVFALNLVTGLGLGLAIDYSLFIVSRYREEIATHGAGMEAMRRTMATAGRTVLFSSLTVAGAIASLIVFPQRFLYSMGIGGSLVALIAAAIALVVLPAVLALLGERVNALSPAFLNRRAERDARPAHEGFWYRLSQLVMRFPGRIAAASAALLIALGIPFLSIQFTSVDAQVLPQSASARQVDDTLRADFPPFRDTPITLAVQGDEQQAQAVARDAGRLAGAGSRSARRSPSATASTRCRWSPPTRRSAPRARTWWSGCATSTTRPSSPASPPTTWTCSRASSTTCRSCSRSSAS